MTYTYTLMNADGTYDQFIVTVEAIPNSDTGNGLSYNVTGITGYVGATDTSGNGGDPISGLSGSSGTPTTSADGLYYIDNAIIMTPGGGVGGSVDGVDNDGLLFTTVGGVEYNFYSNSNGTFSLLTNNGAGFVDSAPTLLNTDAPCFCAGTMVATDTGEAAVEDLSVGDTVLTVSGEHRPIRWIGRRIVATRFADPIGSMPIRIKAGALADNVPVRDMLLSPCHAVLVDGVLIQAGALVNGLSIVRETKMPEVFTYYHIELADHELILAEGTPAETFIDNIDRMAFDNWEEHESLVGTSTDMVEMSIPRAKSARQVPAAIRARISARAATEVAAAA